VYLQLEDLKEQIQLQKIQKEHEDELECGGHKGYFKQVEIVKEAITEETFRLKPKLKFKPSK